MYHGLQVVEAKFGREGSAFLMIAAGNLDFTLAGSRVMYFRRRAFITFLLLLPHHGHFAMISFLLPLLFFFHCLL